MVTNEKKPAAVLCGDLNMLRCFARTAVPTVLVASREDDICFHSRYCRSKRVINSAFLQPAGALDDLVRLGQSMPGKPVLFYGDDAMLLLVSRNRRLLERHYRFLLPETQLVEDLVDKTRFAALARRLELPTPATVLSSENLTVEQILRKLSLPCIFKPNSHVGWFSSRLLREEGGRPHKVLRADNEAELRRLYEKMRVQTSGFVVQEYIPGGENCIYSFHAYLDRNSRPLGYYVGRKIRTYPRNAGVSTYLELVREPGLVELGLEILRNMSFVGMVKIDFKKDPRGERFYVLEFNPRFTLWNYLGATCGINLPLIAYRDLTGQACEPRTHYRTDVRWLSFGDDLRAFVRDYHPSGELTWAGWLRSLIGRKVYDVFSWRDPLPWVVLMVRFIRDRLVKVVAGKPKPKHEATDRKAA
jgi:predicted ATP-grasp superfamily ATP-dependent carboligase